MNTSIHSGTALITGACSGIGVVYANRLARRGHDLVLVARDRDRLCALASGMTDDTGRSIEVLAVDIATKEGLRSVERVLATDASMTMLVNNAGTGATALPPASELDRMEGVIDLGVTAPMRLACAAWPAFAARGHGTIINISPIAARLRNDVYVGATAFVLTLSLSLHHELAPKGIRVQAVLPCGAATAMSVTDVVDSALTGLDLGEIVTIPGRPFANRRPGYAGVRPPS